MSPRVVSRIHAPVIVVLIGSGGSIEASGTPGEPSGTAATETNCIAAGGGAAGRVLPQPKPNKIDGSTDLKPQTATAMIPRLASHTTMT